MFAHAWLAQAFKHTGPAQELVPTVDLWTSAHAWLAQAFKHTGLAGSRGGPCPVPVRSNAAHGLSTVVLAQGENPSQCAARPTYAGFNPNPPTSTYQCINYDALDTASCTGVYDAQAGGLDTVLLVGPT